MELEISLYQGLEQARQELNELEQRYGLSHPSVLRQSMLLDEYINQYNRKYYMQITNRTRKSDRSLSEELVPVHSRLYRNSNTAS
ncbi:aspartyl-phosphate phosphatase Spo0E family protein [Paenibacillus albidus]|uniref:aspartyl-phosphate phosphatase Spo0E family protein n=1 Tax=Paenibacillus albidus TaxID=2041023 RepID=UPI001BE5CCE2|nr:aspartyl-phosphate phosphatase Spo0E family protein [Paenibacillus albidus]MBT2289107.1 aspartyl-phosphate phosphatase Spo0E family protein [Paenibacillus albidus]